MAELKIGEAVSVQFPMVAHAVGIGWTSITPDPTWTVEQNKTGTRSDKPLILLGRLGHSEKCSENILAVGLRNR